MKVSWDAYKMSGDIETLNGDIAFIIDLEFDNGHTARGVGFMEAKRIYSSGKFDVLDWKQLAFLNNNSAAHQLLLYDFAAIPTQYSMGTCTTCHCIWCDLRSSLEKNNASVVMPSAHALAYGVKTRNLEKIGHPVSEQIVLRYFRGLDLNFNTSMVNGVLAGIPGGPAFIFVAKVLVAGEAYSRPGANERNLNNRLPTPDDNSGYERIDPDRLD
jgi:hypothetical protein